MALFLEDFPNILFDLNFYILRTPKLSQENNF